MPFDATLNERGQDRPREFLTALDAPPNGLVTLLNPSLGHDLLIVPRA